MLVKIAQTQRDFISLFKIRTDVFILEQKVGADIELDDYDYEAVHFVAYDNNDCAAGTCRYYYADLKHRIGRLAVLDSHRHQGYATALLLFVEDYLRKIGVNEVHLAAQINAKELYLKNGYQEYGDIFLDANIEHVSMVKYLD